MPSTSPAAGVATEPPRCSQRRVRIGRAPSDPRNHRERELKLRRDNPPPPPSRGGEQLCSRNRFILLLTLLLAQPWLCPRRVTRGHELCQGIDTGGEAGGEGLFAPVRSLGVTVARLTFSPPAGGLGVSPAWHGRAESSSIQPGCKSRTEAPDPTHAEPRGHRSSPSLAVGETGLSPPPSTPRASQASARLRSTTMKLSQVPAPTRPHVGLARLPVSVCPAGLRTPPRRWEGMVVGARGGRQLSEPPPVRLQLFPCLLSPPRGSAAQCGPAEAPDEPKLISRLVFITTC